MDVRGSFFMWYNSNMSRDVEQLIEPFRSKVKALITLAKQDGLPVIVTDTTRTIEEQRENVRKGYSKTMNSKHLTGEAVDIAFQVDGKLSYDAKLYERLYSISKKLSYVIWPFKDLQWNWDYPHFQYDPKKIVKDPTIPYTPIMDYKALYEKEVSEHKETLAQVKSNYDNWQITLDEKNKLRNELDNEREGHRQTLSQLETSRKEVTSLEDRIKENQTKIDQIKGILL